MNEAVKMHAIINSNHDTFICLPSLLQAQLRDTMSPQQCARGTAGGRKRGLRSTDWLEQVIRWVGKMCFKYEKHTLKSISSSSCCFPAGWSGFEHRVCVTLQPGRWVRGWAAGGTNRDSGNTERNITPDWSFDQLSVPGEDEGEEVVNVEEGGCGSLLRCLQSSFFFFF